MTSKTEKHEFPDLYRNNVSAGLSLWEKGPHLQRSEDGGHLNDSAFDDRTGLRYIIHFSSMVDPPTNSRSRERAGISFRIASSGSGR